MHKEPSTQVIFRRFPKSQGGDVIALFPAIAGNVGDPTSCSSYQAIGQHAAASVFLTRVTRPATPAEYAELKKELQRIGYLLQVVKRFTPAHRAARERQLGRMKRELKRCGATDAIAAMVAQYKADCRS